LSPSTEFYTYFLFAGVCLLARGRLRLAIFIALSIAGLLISAWASVNIHNCIEEKGCLSLTYDFGFVRCVHAFFLGALTYYSSRWQRIGPTTLQLTVLFALFLLLTLVDHAPVAAFAFPVAFAALVLSLCNDTGPLADALKLHVFQVLGTRSYSIYLIHMPLLLIFENLTKRANGILSSATILIGYIVTLFVISGWTFRYIEQPLRERFNRMASRSGAATRRTSV
jgi:peptidoglycan/LPS O-acetylase OafA/YrhL